MYTRREWTALASAAARPQPRVHGVRIGLQTYVFTANVKIPQEQWADLALQTMVEVGIVECDLYAPLLEPAELWKKGRPSRAASAEWRAGVSLDHFKGWREKFRRAGVAIYGVSGFAGSTEREFSRTLEIASALGARLVTLGVSMPAARRIAPLVAKTKMIIGLQGRPDLTLTDPDLIAKPDHFLEAVRLAPTYRISLDVGDAVGGGWDALGFVRQHVKQLHLIYLKDRRKDRVSVPWGQGDTPLAEILRFVRDGRHPVRCYIDCDYTSDDRPADIRRSWEFIQSSLA
jgi:hypothetical protein